MRNWKRCHAAWNVSYCQAFVFRHYIQQNLYAQDNQSLGLKSKAGAYRVQNRVTLHKVTVAGRVEARVLRQLSAVVACSKLLNNTSHMSFFSMSATFRSTRVRAGYCLAQKDCLTSIYKRKRFFGACGKGGGEISKHEYNPGKMTKPKGMGRIVITFRLGRFCRTEGRTRGQKLALIQVRYFVFCLTWNITDTRT
jgi:hypothetical protein